MEDTLLLTAAIPPPFFGSCYFGGSTETDGEKESGEGESIST